MVIKSKSERLKMKIPTKKTNNLKKKIFVMVLALCLVLTNVMPAQSLEAVPPPPPPLAPEPPPAPTLQEILAPTSAPTAVPTAQPIETIEPLVEETTPTPSPEPSPDPTPIPDEGVVNSFGSGISQTGEVGDTTIETGDATNSVSLTTVGNTNLSSESGDDSVSQTTEEFNAVSSEKDQTITVIDESSITQDNQASVVNTLEESTMTGGNSASLNVGDSTIVTGDANTSGTIITAVNTNVAGVSVAEFNVADNHVGDIVLDFGESTSATASASSTESEVTVVEDSETFQNNEAVLENNLVLVSDTGNNETSLNTNGDSTIETGDANVSALVLSFVNNNLAGNVFLGVVNIFGSLVGDIILPEEQLAQNTDCGSTDSAQEVNILDSQETFQANDADIENNLILVANTGENEASRNTGGQTSVQTGVAEVQTQVVNVANANIEGGSWWLVIVNEAGEWIGKILGSSEETNFAGSEGTDIRVDENGQVITGQSTTAVNQSNQASISNNIELAANTGKNKANDNTGGNTSINTGDAKIIANIINFVNSNISSDSKLIVTVVNVFGSWVGNFLPPGYEKETDDDNGGNDDNEDNNNDDNNDGEGDNNGGDDGNNGNNGNGGENGNNEKNGDGDGNGDGDDDPEEDEDVVLASDRRLKGGSFVYSSYESYEVPDGSALAAQANETDWGEKPVRVNLAWLTLTIPLFLLLALIRKIAFR